MPVRIYEIAKKAGIPSKDVLAKAKELGITNAKVASSTLDKITAEYLEEQIIGTQESVPAPEQTQATAEPVIITAPEEEPEEEEEEEEEEAKEGTEQEETQNKEEEPSDLGKKVGFIELGNMPVRPAVREHKKKKNKAEKKPTKPTEAEQATSTPAGDPRKLKYEAPADGLLIAMKPPIIVRDLAEEMKRKPFQLIADLMSLNVFA
ncbi:MAG: translation initiation factor IF-2 N-terminal domain-containing protein, partial [Verrucomicrobiota bacterium]|nr:translation initiation factor IF-2 N-terminal domain-containing protein [Verrucomicrobiota bacterium]